MPLFLLEFGTETLSLPKIYLVYFCFIFSFGFLIYFIPCALLLPAPNVIIGREKEPGAAVEGIGLGQGVLAAVTIVLFGGSFVAALLSIYNGLIQALLVLLKVNLRKLVKYLQQVQLHATIFREICDLGGGATTITIVGTLLMVLILALMVCQYLHQ